MKRHCAMCGQFFPTLDEYATCCPDCRPKELALYAEEIGSDCAGCGKVCHPDDAAMCTECGKVVCKTCPATCPHEVPYPAMRQGRAFWQAADNEW